MSSKPTALVTGGAGFIGSHMVDLLVNEGYQVRVIDNLVCGNESNLQHHQSNSAVTADFRDLNDISAQDKVFNGVDVIFHFAGIGDIVPSITDPLKYMRANVMGTVRALEGARHNGISQFLYAASSSCYGIPDKYPTSEASEVRPEYPYALSKWQGENAVLHWGKVYKMRVNSLRLFNIYGTRSRTTGAYGAVFGVFLKQKLAGKAFTVVGDGTQKRDFLYVSDCVQAFLDVSLSDAKDQIFNIGAGNPQSLNRLVELLGGPVTNIPKRPGEPDCTWADISKIHQQVGWQPKVSFMSGVEKVLANIDYWENAPLWDERSIADETKVWFDMLGNNTSGSPSI